MPHSSPPAQPRESSAPRELVVATANLGKLREFRALLAGLPFKLTGLAELGLPSPDETASTFVANAELKARHAARLSGSAAVADDSGIEVDALDGAPGIYSARYAGLDADDAANNAKLIRALDGLPPDQRGARYRCALVFLEADDAQPLVAEASWEGVLLEAPLGAGGFGYDPYFWLPELGRTAAELSPEEKNRLSHRGKAMQTLRDLLRRRFGEQPTPGAER
ncbi:MAG: XTP/dITP diphosphohydrolase [Gammaproteobacteria bacterium]|jgi:XTP/dITP diphosphohydrolase|nr:nucleoside-triphosphate diphosphatase [Gammaproteobacteria bacterium]MEA3139558.1 XTP/dITP diphosphohydrolase [Gammaproteobacteria bacterium]